MSEVTTQAAQPPATPIYILRGHASPIHALHLFNRNLRLVSADANGWIVVWDLVMKRPVAVWKAHEGAVLEVKAFAFHNGVETDVYTHGRDHKLRVWRFRRQDEEILQKTLPVDVSEGAQSDSASQPWLVHSLSVNALNFCAFAILFIGGGSGAGNSQQDPSPEEASSPPQSQSSPRSAVLIAVPNALNSGAIDIFHLPSERRVCTIPADTAVQTGMVMAASLFTTSSGDLYVACAFEDGHVAVFARRGPVKAHDIAQGAASSWKWEKLYACRPHTQPVLSIDVFPRGNYFLSSSADALLVKHPIPPLNRARPLPGNRPEDATLKTVNTKHAGQQGLRIRSDGKVFATAGWDSRIRVYSCKTMRELAVLKWHKEGCYTVAFADVSKVADLNDMSTDERSVGKRESEVDDGHRQLARRDQGSYTLEAVQHQRSQKVQQTHWLAAGSKDGKISLWDIY
ncbi:WD40 repeat domain-containing protein [Aspergillus clavatus NRRL 1]|uniref:ASTRA-associated protein 1 n=1 Tax=Aspergillus clavatus (strain ATCC 1007 / CBS 513.65 / DSM 816 / NCTC 3887 / NRRL 1 / QM 1276 / 107) TaxID=344612 RepID=A1CB56_ASPCL|nr:WD repeat protein [Aspergillus clavatus NRRL 1]EAW12974.1 WD repeat protein [Aspergillus clavatus NRRL 1]